MEEGIPCHMLAGVFAGLAACVIGSPVDVLKNRIMNAHAGQFTSMFDCISSTFKEGPLSFYKGLQANATRIVSWNVITFVSLEQIRKMAG